MPQLAIRPYYNFGNNNLSSNIMDNSEFNIPYSSMNQDINNNNNNNNNIAPRQVENDNTIASPPIRPKRHVSSSNNFNDLNFNKKRIAKNYDFINNNSTTTNTNNHNKSNDNHNATTLTNHNNNINNIHTNVSPYKRISIYSELNSTNKSNLPNIASPKDASRRASINKNSIDTPQPSLRLSDQAHSPFYVSNNSYPNLNNRNMKNINSGVKINEMNTENPPFENHTFLTIKELTNTKSTFIDNSTEQKETQTRQTELSNNNTNNNNTNNNTNIPSQQENMNQDANNNNNNSAKDNGDNSEGYNNNNSNLNNNEDNGNNNNNNSNNNSNNSISNNKRSSQALVQKLQEIYKVIVKQEIELQERCSQLTTSQTTELKNLWTIYRINIDLINNYITFITTALLPSQSPQDILIGEEIVEIYRIERRLWVYGTITFLDVLKNFSNFMDPEVCAQFITHVFISLSSILIDIPPKHAIPWLQRLGDLSRMAIALYPSGFIDWKLSAEHWYMEAMRFTYSHGKLYYHMSTVQQNTLEAFVNLGKSVFCQDTFTPSQQYMQLVIDNIYQRTFVERSSTGNYRNADLIDYLKHSEVMLLPSFLGSNDLQQVVLNYFQDRFGIDFNDNNIFNTNNIFCQPPASLRFFFRHAPAFAESHILQLVGFGNPKNPFALLFDLPKYLKERKDKKEKNKSKSSSSNGDVSTGSTTTLATTVTDINNSDNDKFNNPSIILSGMSYLDNVDSLKYPIEDPDICTWIKSLDYINMTSLKCSMIVLKKFLHAPFVITLPHLLPWTYFIIASGLKIKNLHDEKSYKFWRILLKRIFPWNTITSFLNVLLAYVLDNFYESRLIEELSNQYSQMSLEELLEHFNENEDLPEVWKCWGTLWFDVISDKYSINADTLKGYGIDDHMFLDFPIDGIGFDPNDESGEKFWRRAIRVIFLFKGIADNFEFGLKVNFKTPVYCNRDDINKDQILRQFSFKLEPYNEPTSSKFNEFIPLCEDVDGINSDLDAVPELSIIPGENIFEYTGYHRLSPDINSYDKNGEFVGSSLYTSWMSDQMQPQSATSNSKPINEDIELTNDTMIRNDPGNNAVNDFNLNSTLNSNNNNNGMNDVKVNRLINEMNENDLFKSYMNCKTSTMFMNKKTGEQHIVNNIWKTPYDEINRELTYFVFDATSWLRHFAHIYKLATNDILKFGVCLTTFQELRFLRKSKDENVVEAASRAIITMRQLYSEGKLLPLRFTGNVATDIEEHLEFEEQITWRSHVDEFVIEAVMKAQEKFTLSRGAVLNNNTTNNDNNSNSANGAFNKSSSSGSENHMGLMNPLHSYDSNTSGNSILNSELSPAMSIDSVNTHGENATPSNDANHNSNNNTRFQYIVLVTNDQNMKSKAQNQNIKTFSTDFIFSICSKLGMDLHVCTN
ncbi:EST/SMG-like protein 2 [Monosporozyma servazzii]